MTTALNPGPDEKHHVWNPRDMSREQFCLHMTIRHPESLGGMSELNPAAMSDYMEDLWRRFHAQLHGKLLRYELEHDHDE